MRLAFLVTVAVATASSAGAATLKGNVSEILALPDGYVIAAPASSGFTRTGACGAWGCNMHQRVGPTVNDQFNPSDRVGGAYLNSNGIGGMRLQIDLGQRSNEAYFSLVDAFDKRPTQSFTATVRERTEDGRWTTTGSFSIDAREESGTVHYLRAKLKRAARYVVVRIDQVSRKIRSGDIVAVGVGRHKACRS